MTPTESALWALEQAAGIADPGMVRMPHYTAFEDGICSGREQAARAIRALAARVRSGEVEVPESVKE